ncbi:AlpA family transcriptional regulator [Phytobacter sp. RSE-02]|uniref:helix-turn-helix transcriptional regulator n=1 Tax=Phytobacter sp. RSE-02 TaxID=3229229 RepID=UPI00339D4734
MQKMRSNLTDESLIDMLYITNDSGFSDRYFYLLIKKNEFPPPIKFGRSSRWLLKEYSAWKARHIFLRNKKE